MHPKLERSSCRVSHDLHTLEQLGDKTSIKHLYGTFAMVLILV